MNVFELDADLIARYEQFARSFTNIRADDLSCQIDEVYANGTFWPEPLIGLNPQFRAGRSLTELVGERIVDPALDQIFSLGAPRKPLSLHCHQEEALVKALQRRNYIVTTGTGSGKSLCFFVPIIDRILKARRAKEPRRTRAIIIYPMNALANSQREELDKFIDGCGVDDQLKPTFARYTGQDQESDRRKAAENAPDIILTNFMMLELLMTRQDEIDRQVIANMEGLEFLVLDELHTYRGRQGADVAMLVRRVRERMGSKHMMCIGTSATMASGEKDAGQKAVAAVGTTLFGSPVAQEDVVTESLQRRTEGLPSDAALRAAVVTPLPAPTIDVFTTDPLACWIEMNIGLDGGEVLKRRIPRTLTDAAADLAQTTGLNDGQCRDALAARLIAMSECKDERDQAFLAFKLHRFLSGAGSAHATLAPAAERRVSLVAEKFDRDESDARLYPVFFCRDCGQEVHSVSIDPWGTVIARPIDLTPRGGRDEDGVEHGFLIPDSSGDLQFTGAVEDYPDNWIELSSTGTPRLKSTHRGKHDARRLNLGKDGRRSDDGLLCWFFPGAFRFCPRCKSQPPSQARDINKLAGQGFEAKLIVPALVDYDKWLGQDVTASPLPKQVEAMDRVSQRADGPAVHGYVAFDPLRQAYHNADLDAGFNSIDLVELALKEKGFLGVKLYPPMGFKPIGNSAHSQAYPEEVTRALNGQVGPALDQALTALYELCVGMDAPVIAHANRSNGAGNDFADRADPAFWLPVFGRWPKLRVCLAHFGQFSAPSASAANAAMPDGSWEWTFGTHIAAQPDSNVYADISYLSEVFSDPDKLKVVAATVRTFVAKFDPEVRHLMFGTDWIMLGLEGDYPSYTSRVFEFFSGPCGFNATQMQSLFHLNAERFLGLERGTQTWKRLTSYYVNNKLPLARVQGLRTRQVG